MGRSVWTKWGARLSLTVLATIVTLSFAEIVVSAVDPYGVSYFPNLKLYDREVLVPSPDPALIFQQRPAIEIDAGVPIRTNALGMRNREVVTPKPVGTRRILFMGDSVTFGWGVRESERFTSRIESKLAARGEPLVEVVNAGVVHYNTVQESRLLARVIAPVDPDLVCVVYTANDLYVADGSPIEGRAAPTRLPADLDGLIGGFDWWLLTNQVDLSLAHMLRYQTMVRLARVDADAADADRQRELASRLEGHLASSSPVLDPGGCVAALLDMRRQCAARGIELVVAPYDAPEVLVAFCRAKGIPILDDSEVASDPLCRLSATDAHPNAMGHERMAESFARSLCDRGLLPAPSPEILITASSPGDHSRR